MNSLDDFARLRPDDVVATTEELDALWPFDQASDLQSASPRGGRDRWSHRRVAVVGAAASLVVGLVALASLTDRAEAPRPVGSPTSELAEPPPSASRSSAVLTTQPATQPTQPTAPISAAVDPIVEAGEPPLWGIDGGWRLTEFEDMSHDSGSSLRLVAGPDGLSRSWVAIVSGVSPPLLPIQAPPAGAAPGESAISTQRIDSDEVSAAVIAGGVSDAEARSVFDAVRTSGSLPDGFTETNSASAAVRRVRYRFTSESGETVDIDVQGGGSPRYDLELAAATAAESWDGTVDVDESTIAYAGGYSLLVRNGFWVSRITTSAPADAPQTFVRLAELVQPVSPTEHRASLPTSSSGVDRLAIGASVMLGPAAQLTDAGFAVDAVESRSFAEGLDVIRELAERDRLPDRLVIDLAANAAIDEADLTEMLELVSGLDRVVFVTTRATFAVNESNNELIRSLPDRRADVVVLDWAVLADSCPGDCFAADALHLDEDGRRYYAASIVDAVA